jgi:hypothetical protein
MRNQVSLARVALMMRRTVVVLAISIGAVSAVARFFCGCGEQPASAPHATMTPQIAASEPVGTIDVIASPSAASFETRRNLFAFVTAPVVVRQATPVASQATPTVVAHETVVAERAPESESLTIPYRFIGCFGPRDNPIGVFAGDGELINARVGDAVGRGFVLRVIGIESATIAIARDPSRLIRLPIGGQ